MDEVFKIQDEIGNKVLGQLQIEAVLGEQAKKWMTDFDTFEQYQLFLDFFTEWRKYS